MHLNDPIKQKIISGKQPGMLLIDPATKIAKNRINHQKHTNKAVRVKNRGWAAKTGKMKFLNRIITQGHEAKSVRFFLKMSVYTLYIPYAPYTPYTLKSLKSLTVLTLLTLLTLLRL